MSAGIRVLSGITTVALYVRWGNPELTASEFCPWADGSSGQNRFKGSAESYPLTAVVGELSLWLPRVTTDGDFDKPLILQMTGVPNAHNSSV